MKKLIALLLAVCMVLGLMTTVFAADEKSNDIVILYTNDVHCAVDDNIGYAGLAAYKKEMQAAYNYVALVDCGDSVQGDVIGTLSKGEYLVDIMNELGYDFASFGNHEFDYTLPQLQKLIDKAKYQYLCCNLTYTAKDGKGLTGYKAYEIKTYGNTKVAFVGIDTPESFTKSTPTYFQDANGNFVYSFAEGNNGADLYNKVQETVNAAKKDGATYVVAIAHLGIDESSEPWRSTDLIANTTGIDVVLDGHSHSTVASEEVANKAGETVLLTSTGTKLENIGVVTIKDSAITTECVPTEGIEIPADSEIAARAAAIIAEVDAEYGTVFAKTEVTLNGEKAPGNRTEETNLGDLITDALVWKATQEGEAVDAAITNGGGIRATIEAGDITKKDINTVLPFGNTLSIIKITGSELLEVLEASTFCTPEAIGGFPQVSGIEFTVDTTKAYDADAEYPGTTYFAPKSINRVTIQSVGGKDFDPAATYTIATNDFMASGGDTYYRFVNATANYDLGIAMDEVVMQYITEVLGGTVTADKYGEATGRITVVS